MNTIKNLHKIEHLLTDADIIKLEAGATLHKRHSNIHFKIESINVIKTVLGPLDEINIGVTQDKSSSENYADIKILVDRTKELFQPFLPKYKINVHPKPYSLPDVNIVTDKWVNEQMLHHGIKVKNIAADTGIDRTNISAWINGTRDMSQIVKAMFYYYFAKV